MDPEFGDYDDTYSFNTGIDPEIYTVEGADALEPADSTATTLIRYPENNMRAAVAYRGEYRVVAMGFPFETIMEGSTRDLMMKEILSYLTSKKRMSRINCFLPSASRACGMRPLSELMSQPTGQQDLPDGA